MPPEPRFTAVVLAAQRAGHVDPLAAEASVSHKCLVPIDGAALIAHVVAALRATPGLVRLRIVVEPGAVPAIEAALPRGLVAVDFVPAANNLSDSVHAACRDVDGPIVVTTADNVLLTPLAAAQVVHALAGADAVLAMARKADVLAAHPNGQRRFYRFSDDEYSNCNLYGLSGRDALAVAESFRSGGQFAKKPLRIILAFGPLTLVLMLLHRLSLAGALARVSRRFGLRVVPIILADGAHAIDVDNSRTYDVAEILLEWRRAAAMPGRSADGPCLGEAIVGGRRFQTSATN